MKKIVLLDGVENGLEDKIDELMNDSDIEFVFEKEDSEKEDVSNDQSKNIYVMKDRVKNPEDNAEKSQEDKVDVLEAKEKLKGKSKEKEKRKGKEKGKG